RLFPGVRRGGREPRPGGHDPLPVAGRRRLRAALGVQEAQPGRGRMTPALDGLRVVEGCTGIGGPYAGKLLTDPGAHVTKVEPPQGDPLRVDAEGSAAPGALFEYLNAGKDGLCLDLTDAAGRRALEAVLGKADLVLADDPLEVPESVRALVV